MAREPLPLRYDYGAGRRRGADLLTRAATAFLLKTATSASTKDVLRQHWPDDRAVELVLRAAVAPAAETGWGGAALVPVNVAADFLGMLGPSSAAATLLSRGLSLEFVGTNKIRVPGIATDPNSVTFLGEGSPIPVVQFDTANAIFLQARKLAGICVFTAEVFQYSIPSIEAIVKQALVESIGRKFDQVLFDTAAASSTRPAGLLNGIGALTAAAVTPPAIDAVTKDVQSLVAAVTSVSGNGPIVLVAAPKQALSLRLYFGARLPYEVLSSAALGTGTVIAVASNCLVSALDPAPRFETANDALVVLDTAPPSSQPSIGFAAQSLFQANLVGLRTIFQLSWGLRSANGVAWLMANSW